MGGHLPSKFTTFLHVANPTKGISYNKQQSTQFCHTSCSTHQIDFTGSVQLIKDAQWEKIIQGTKQYAKDKKNIPSSSDIIIISDDEGMPKFNPCTNLIEVDSEEEDTKDRNEDTKDGKGTKLVNAGKVVKAGKAVKGADGDKESGENQDAKEDGNREEEGEEDGKEEEDGTEQEDSEEEEDAEEGASSKEDDEEDTGSDEETMDDGTKTTIIT